MRLPPQSAQSARSRFVGVAPAALGLSQGNKTLPPDGTDWNHFWCMLRCAQDCIDIWHLPNCGDVCALICGVYHPV